MLFLKIGPLLDSFIFVFIKQSMVNKIANDCIWTRDVWCWKHLLYHLHPNHCPLKLCYFLTIYFPFQGLVIIIIVLARIGWRGATIAHFIDPLWLTSITTGAYILILGTLYFTYILGEQIAYKMVNWKSVRNYNTFL